MQKIRDVQRCSMLYLGRLETTWSIHGFKSLNDIVQKSQALEWRRVRLGAYPTLKF